MHSCERVSWGPLLAESLMAFALNTEAQSADIVRAHWQFDVANNTGHDAYGFEVELQGLNEGDVYYTFSAQRYGAPTVVPYTGGVYVRWTSQYSSSTSSFLQHTVPHTSNQPFQSTCYQWNPATYQAAGCEHSGVSLRANPTKTTGRWLVKCTSPRDTCCFTIHRWLLHSRHMLSFPLQVGAAPAVEIEINAPEPAEAPELYGDAQWMKVLLLS